MKKQHSHTIQTTEDNKETVIEVTSEGCTFSNFGKLEIEVKYSYSNLTIANNQIFCSVKVCTVVYLNDVDDHI